MDTTAEPRRRPKEGTNPRTGRRYSQSNEAKMVMKRRLRFVRELCGNDRATVAAMLGWCDEHHSRVDGKQWTEHLIAEVDSEAETARAAVWLAHKPGPAVSRHHGPKDTDA